MLVVKINKRLDNKYQKEFQWTSIDMRHALLHSQLRLLVPMLIVSSLGVEAAEATPFRREARGA